MFIPIFNPVKNKSKKENSFDIWFVSIPEYSKIVLGIIKDFDRKAFTFNRVVFEKKVI